MVVNHTISSPTSIHSVSKFKTQLPIVQRGLHQRKSPDELGQPFGLEETQEAQGKSTCKNKKSTGQIREQISCNYKVSCLPTLAKNAPSLNVYQYRF